ncbi:hypothetical protein CRUP_024595 [Coryphaenoides rupestris]|nr:hypothetical protein CRUP_024595 [Coryphaenoides rupestris]
MCPPAETTEWPGGTDPTVGVLILEPLDPDHLSGKTLKITDFGLARECFGVLLWELLTYKELRSWEEALARAAEEQREQEELLRRREQELAEREIDIVERELNIIIHQMYQEKPRVKKRKGHFKKSRLLKLARDSNCISLPSGFEHKITVQASPSVDKRKGMENTTPPASPGVIPGSGPSDAKWLSCQCCTCITVTPSDGSKTWGRSAVCKKEDLSANKKKGRTWGPSSTHQRERVGGEDKLKSLGEGCKVWSSSAPNLGKSPKHAPMTAGFSSLNEMEEFCEFETSPGALVPQEPSSNGGGGGGGEDSGSLWGSLGGPGGAGGVGVGVSGVGCQDALRRCSQRKKSDLLLLGSATSPCRCPATPDSTLPCGDPSPSVTLLSLSSLSDCNSTKSLLPLRPGRLPPDSRGRGRRGGGGAVGGGGVRLSLPPPAPTPALNPLLDLRAESFKKEPNPVAHPHPRVRHHGAEPGPPGEPHQTGRSGRAPRPWGTAARPPTGACPCPRTRRRKAPAPPAPVPLAPDPDLHCLTSPMERPKTLEFAPRPRPTPARVRADPWKLGSLSRTLSSSPGSSCESPLGSGDSGAGTTKPNLMDMDMEGQNLDSTEPLCGKAPRSSRC